MFCLCFVIQYPLAFKFCNQFDEEERAGCFTFIFSLMVCDCKCSVTFPRGNVGYSAVCSFRVLQRYFVFIDSL